MGCGSRPNDDGDQAKGRGGSKTGFGGQIHYATQLPWVFL